MKTPSFPMLSRYAIASNPESKAMIRCKRIATHMLTQYKRWTSEQRQILEKLAKRGYLVGDIWKVLDAFGQKPEWHTGKQVGICIPILPIGTSKIENAYKSQLQFCLL